MRRAGCNCARCRGLATANPKYGYDMAEVSATECLKCGERIGTEPYVEVPILARFGQMFLLHRRCKSTEGRPGRRRAEYAPRGQAEQGLV
jgi:hypothetical protein